MDFEAIWDQINTPSDVTLDLPSLLQSLIAGLIIGCILKVLYGLYFRDNEPQDGSLARSLVLLTPSLTAIFWMIQTSVVLSLGLLGSMSFVRFRTPVKRSEDVTFIVLALASAISCATHNFGVSICLLILFLGFTVVRNYFGDGLASGGKFAIITFNTKQDIAAARITAVLDSVGLKSDFVSSRTYDGITSYVVNVAKLEGRHQDSIRTRLSELDSSAHINIFYPNDRIGA